MDFVAGKCPKCQGDLQIPKHLEKIICMYCGETILLGDATVAEIEQDSVEMNTIAYDRFVQIGMEGLPQMLFGLIDPMKAFKKAKYEEAFLQYYKEQAEIIEAIVDAYEMTDIKEALLHEFAQNFVNQVNDKVILEKNKRHQEDALINYNMSMVIYVFPALLHKNNKVGQALADEILSLWKQSFPKSNLKYATFEQINSGFRRKFCYLTTAVCESLGKPDDCYELTLLRNYRDGYLQEQADGDAIVKKYYDVAPTIVNRVNKLKNAKEVYRQVYDDYLAVCIRYIEENQNEACKTVYINMVNTLEEKYFA